MADIKSRTGRMRKPNPKTGPGQKQRLKTNSHAQKINRTLFHIANAVNTSFDLDDLYTTIHTILSDVIDVTNFYIALYDKKTDTISFPFHCDVKDTVQAYGDGGVIRHASESISLTAQIIKIGKRFFFQKDDILKRYQNSAYYGTISEQWLGVPLRVKDEIIGAIVVQSYTDPDLYKQSDADLLLAVSDQIALAIELRRALDIIKESEQRYRTLAEKTNDVIFSIDAEGYFTDISPAIENITGYAKEEITGQRLINGKIAKEKFGTKGWYRQSLAKIPCPGIEYEKLIHPEDRPWVSQRIREAVENLSAYHLEYRLIKKNGRMHWISERAVVYENHERQKQIEGMIQDIHKRKYAEDINQVLFSISNAVNITRNLDELYRSIHDALSKIIDVSNLFIGLYNKPTDSMQFSFLIDEFDFKDSKRPELKNISDPKSGALSGRVLRTGKPLLIKKKERLEWIKNEKLQISTTPAEVWVGVPLIINNEVIGVMATQDYHDPNHYDEHDIEILSSVSYQVALAIERRRSEEALKESKERYQHLVDNIGDIIFSIDAESHFTYLSPAVETITGYGIQDFKGRFINWNEIPSHDQEICGAGNNNLAETRLFESIIHPEDRKAVIHTISESVHNLSHYAIEYRIIKNDGRSHWVYEKGIAYEDPHRGKGIEGIIQDIHKRKHAEEINQVLYSISSAVNTSQNLNELYQSIHRSLSRIIDATNFWIALYDKANDSLTTCYSVDTVDGPERFSERKHVSDPNSPLRISEVIRTGKPVLSTKKQFTEELEKRHLEPVFTLSEIWLGVPLKIKEEVMGAICVHSYTNAHLYEEKDKEILLSVSDQIALAIDRKKAEEALQVEKVYLEQLFENAKEGIAMTDPQGAILKINNEFTQIFGYESEEAMGNSLDEMIAPEELLQEARFFTKVLANGKLGTIEVCRQKKDKSLIHVIATGVPIMVDGIVVGMYHIYRDITEQKKSNMIMAVLYEITKAVNSTKNLDELFQIIHQSLGRILDTTNFYIALYDHEKEVIAFVYFRDEKDAYIPVISVNHSGSLTAKVIRQKKTMILHEEEIRKIQSQSADEALGSVSKIWLGVPLLIKGEIIGVVVMQSYADPLRYTTDDIRLLESVSEQIAIAIDSKRTKDALQESEKRYRTIFDGTADAIFVQDFSSRFMDVNEVACERYGYSRDEFIKLSPKEITTPDRVKNIGERVADIIKRGRYITETIHVKNDGSYIPTELSSKVIEYEGKQAILSVARDISERKQAEEEKRKLEDQLRQAQKMEAIGTLAGGIAHDFNNILSPIIGYTELSLHDMVQDDKARKNMYEVLKAAERAKNLVKQILTFSRQSEQEPKPIKVGPIIQEVAKLLQATLPANIQIVLRISEEQGTLMADPTQIHQVLMNLGTNAYHAMRMKGGILEIKLSEVIISPEDHIGHHNLMPGTYLKLTVSDTGHGINPKILERIFDPYFTTKDPGEGTGMGLAVVHGIVKGYKGEIHVYSEPGIGTAFHIYLPEIASEVTLPQSEIAQAAPGGNERILLVDDEEQIVDMMQQMLLHLGYQVTARTSSIEALEAFKAQPHKFDLVLTDQTMPNLSGAELAQALMQIRPEIPVILCTGFSEVVTETQAKAIGIREYVMKPIIKNEMAAAIRRALDQ